MIARLLIALFLSSLLGGCERNPDSVPGARVVRAEAETPEPAPVFPEPPEPGCVAVEPQLVACPDDETLRVWAEENHTPEPAEDTLVAALDPPDPTPIRDGLVVYDDVLAGVARRTRSHLELWTNTPAYNAAETAVFKAHPELWRAVAEFRGASSNEQIRLLRAAIRAKDSAQLRAMLLRNGIFFLEDPDTAAYAAKYVGLRQIFDEEELELHRGGLRHVLRRDDRGNYLHFNPVLDEATATLHLFDRVGPLGTLPPMFDYGLQELRRTHGLSNVVASEETSIGRSARVRFFNGEEFDGALALRAEGGSMLGVVASPARLIDVRAANVRDRTTICSLLEVADMMVGEHLEFDEPKVEYGQQDGRLRPRFQRAYDQGRTTYAMNGVTYQVFDKENRPKVPQLCIDFVTDVVVRSHGIWWNPRGTPPDPEPAAFDIRDYVRYRSVRSLLQLGKSTPSVAHVEPMPAVIPYGARGEFFENLWRLRDGVREGDVIVIYGLRADNRNHFHSFYVRETDPVYGVPIVLVAQPGFARIQAWHDVMWESPKRAIRNIVRWNPDWLRSPFAVDAAVRVSERALTLTMPPAASD